MTTAPKLVTLIGFGEAGSTFARAGKWGKAASAWDILPDCRADMAETGVQESASAQDAISSSPLILSLVTADQAPLVATNYSSFLVEGAIWCDLNSVAPATKRQAAEVVEAHGGRYVDVAVMAPVDPAALSVPLLISGGAAQEAEILLNQLGFAKTRIVGNEVGRASAIKMVRSVMVKGLEALSSECAAAADAAGVFDEVMASLDASEKAWPWAERVAYNRERMATHGLRRAAEMEESAKTLEGLGIEPVMTRGTVALQRRAATPKDERK